MAEVDEFPSRIPDGVKDRNGFVFNSGGNQRDGKVVDRVHARATVATSLSERVAAAQRAMAAAEQATVEAESTPAVERLTPAPALPHIESPEFRELRAVPDEPDDDYELEVEDDTADALDEVGAFSTSDATDEPTPTPDEFDRAAHEFMATASATLLTPIVGDKKDFKHPFTGDIVTLTCTRVEWNEFDGELEITFSHLVAADSED